MSDGRLLRGPDDVPADPPVETDLGGLDEPPQRGAYRRRHTRQTLTFLVLVSLVLFAGLIGYLAWQGVFDLGGSGKPVVVACPTVTQTAAASNRTQVNVYNASGKRGLAGAVARELQLRGFTVPTIANDSSGLQVVSAVQVRYGKDSEPQARTVAAQFKGEIEMLLDEGRTDGIVDVSLGEAYTTMKTVPEALTLLTAPPAPSPEGCVVPDDAPSQRPLVVDPRPPTTTGSPSPSPTS